ncbi:MAG: 1-acyl-sn-glycerol-3-phosphate acyltransferase [Pseudomonadota bacterium]|nr:1-acyl-sn-glycerol-3-phosphate acyltransferase [Pseudomonadota bacterium]MDE3037727.1 1-acyl-sn-glycerol-3-phosphate acyltransferase [Pseudomonadota bacterium]
MAIAQLPKFRIRLPKWRLMLPEFFLNPEPFYRNIAHSLTLRVYKPRYIGFENIPAQGPAILICNHVSYMDGPIIDAGCKRRVRYLIDEDIYNTPGVHYLMRMDRAIPIAPNRKSVERAFDEISAGLKNGELVCIFPEGFLTFTGGLGRFRPGIEWILKRDPVPVVPMALSGLWGSVFSRKYLKSPFRWFPRKWGRKVTAICGPAIPAEQVNVNRLQDVVLKLKYSIGQ